MLSPQPLFAAQPLVQSHRLQLIHDPSPHLHHPVPMPQQLPQIPILPTRYPDLGKTILHQQLQNMLRILPIRLLLAFALPGDLGGVPDPQLEVQFRHESLEPACMPTSFHSHSHLLALGCEVTIKLFCSLTVLQSLLSVISRLGIYKRNLLETRVIIASYNDHCPAPFYPSLHGWFGTTKFTRAWEPALLWNQLR